MAQKNRTSLLLVCIGCFMVVEADVIKTAYMGQLFVYELNREVFQKDFDPSHNLYGSGFNVPVVFKCNKQHFPDLPRWLRFTQRHPLDNGFLYGTPQREDLGKHIIEITVVNKRSYEIFRERLVINVNREVNRMPYQAEFFISLREIEKVLPTDVREEIKEDIQKIWKTDQVYFVNITSALDRGGRVPLPLPGHFEGVYVKLGSDQQFSKCLKSLLSAEHERECKAGGKISGDCSTCSNPSNCVTWCNSTLFDLSHPVPPTQVPTVGSGILAWVEEFKPLDSPPERDYTANYIITVIVPFVIALVFCLLLAYIMCCRREGVHRRDAMTPELQLYHHYTIHGNCNELRSMTGSRENVPRPLSSMPMFNAHTGQNMPSQYPSDNIHVPLIMAQQEPNVDTLPRK